MTPEWGRVWRGSVYHLLAPDLTARCGSEEVHIVEVTRGMPPMGARPCERCVAWAVDLAAAATNARDHNSLTSNT